MEINEIDKVKKELHEMFPQYRGIIEHTTLAEMCLKYHQAKLNHGVSHHVIETKQKLAMQMIETERQIEDIREGGVGDNDDDLIDSLIGKYEKYEEEYNSL